MRLVKWTDHDGYKHLSSIRDNDPDSEAPNGIPNDPPILDDLDWEEVKRELHNLLVDRGLITWLDIQQKGGLRAAIITVMKSKIIHLYRSNQ